MSTYCISDIHGEWEKYQAMLKLIDFSDADKLFVIGDCIDRHPLGIDILLDIMERPNVQLILGNHEDLLLKTLGPHNEIGARQLWQQNGGSSTRRDLLYCRPPEVRKKIISFLLKLPDHLDIEVNGKKYHLVHGYPGDNQDDRIWNRPPKNGIAPLPGKTVIIGHTPTVFLKGDDGQPFTVWHGDGIICIDCGCGNKTLLRRLACLRLDDLQEFYV